MDIYYPPEQIKGARVEISIPAMFYFLVIEMSLFNKLRVKQHSKRLDLLSAFRFFFSNLKNCCINLLIEIAVNLDSAICK